MTIRSNSRLEALERGTFRGAVDFTRTHIGGQSAIKGTSLENNPSSFFCISFLYHESSIDPACMHSIGTWNDSVPASLYLTTARLSPDSQNT